MSDDYEARALLDTLAVWRRVHDAARFPCRCSPIDGLWDDRPCAFDAIPLALLCGMDVGWRP